jgi:uncharacterized protein with HEPN domain
MRPEELYLTDIIEAADAIQRFVRNVDQNTFLKDELLQSAVLQKLMIIGEAASRLPKEFRDRNPEIEWEDIIGFRNIAVSMPTLPWNGRLSGWLPPRKPRN